MAIDQSYGDAWVTTNYAWQTTGVANLAGGAGNGRLRFA